jgi:hypothetical protein
MKTPTRLPVVELIAQRPETGGISGQRGTSPTTRTGSLAWRDRTR